MSNLLPIRLLSPTCPVHGERANRSIVRNATAVADCALLAET